MIWKRWKKSSTKEGGIPRNPGQWGATKSATERQTKRDVKSNEGKRTLIQI
jgi:hypothetical protein